MSGKVTLVLSDALLERARHTAEALGEPLETVLTATLAAGLPDVENVPAEMRQELARMIWASDTDLRAIAHAELAAAMQAELEQLNARQAEQSLSEREAEKLEALRLEYARMTLRKARAYALLSLRNGNLPLAT